MKPGGWIEALQPKLLEGGVTVDDRGSLVFCNDVDLAGVRRFYVVTNHTAGRVRAWHAHRNERKLMWPVSGSTLVGLVHIEDWDRPSKETPVSRLVLSVRNPQLLVVPAGFANGTMSLTPDASILVLSSSTLEDSIKDDFRFDARYWDPWNIQER